MMIGDQERGLPMGTFELYGRAKVNACRTDLERAKFIPRLAEDRKRWRQLGNMRGSVGNGSLWATEIARP